MGTARRIGAEEARRVGSTLGVDWGTIEPRLFHRHLEEEIEQVVESPQAEVTADDLTLTGRIVWARLKDFPDYYAHLHDLETAFDARPPRADAPDD